MLQIKSKGDKYDIFINPSSLSIFISTFLKILNEIKSISIFLFAAPQTNMHKEKKKKKAQKKLRKKNSLTYLYNKAEASRTELHP